MENRAHAIIAICFLIVFTVAAVLIWLQLSSGPDEPLAYRIVTRQSVAGISPQSTVEFKGIEVGHVTRIRFDPADRSRVIVDFRVRRNTYVTHATYAVLTMHGLTGGDVLELKLGKGSTAPLATSSQHPALIPLHKGLLARLEDSAAQDMQAVHAVLASAQKLLDDDNRAHIGATLKQLDQATAKLVAIETRLLPAVQQMPALAASLHKSLEQSHALLANANQLAISARDPVRKAGKLEDTLQHLGSRLDTRTTPDIGQLTRSLTRTSRLLDELIRQLKAQPQSLIFSPSPPRPGPGEPGFHSGENHGDEHGQ